MDVADDETRNVTVLMVMMTVMMMRWRRIISHLYSQTQPQNAEKKEKNTHYNSSCYREHLKAR